MLGNQLNYPAYDSNEVVSDYQDFGKLPQEPTYYQVILFRYLLEMIKCHLQHYIEEVEISTETYPNALHVLKLNISTIRGTGGQKPQPDQANDIDGYGSPLGSVISFNDFNVNNFEDEDISDDNDVATIPQIPSANIPDQENPEKYINNEIETINKVLDNPIFYYEPSDQFTKSYYSYYSS